MRYFSYLIPISRSRKGSKFRVRLWCKVTCLSGRGSGGHEVLFLVLLGLSESFGEVLQLRGAQHFSNGVLLFLFLFLFIF